MKILFYVWGFDQGGVATAFTSLARHLESRGHEIQVVIPGWRNIPAESIAIPRRYIVAKAPSVMPRFTHGNFIFNTLKFNVLWNYVNSVTRWRPYFLRLPSHLCHDCFVLYHSRDYFWRWFRNCPSIVWFHETVSDWMYSTTTKEGLSQRIFRKSTIKAVRGFDYHVAVSQASAISNKSYYGLTDTPQVIGNLFDFQKIQEASEQFVAEIPQDGTPNIVYIGRLSVEKGVDRLLDATGKILSDGIRFRLWIIGAGPQDNALRQSSAAIQYPSNIRFLGPRDNPYPYFRVANLTVLPSHTEGNPMVLWESIICGTPVMSTDCGGTRETLNNGNWGRIVKNSTAGIEQGLRAFLRNESWPDIHVAMHEVEKVNTENRERIDALFATIERQCHRQNRMHIRTSPASR